METLIPRRLKKGDLIGIIAPASPVTDTGRTERGVRYLERLGYNVLVGNNVAQRTGYLAGTDQERADDLHAMFADRNVRGIFCARGGYGTARLLPILDYRLIRKNPKILLGYSDITALALALWKKCRLVTYHGPMPAVEMAGELDPFTEESLWRTLTSPARRMTVAQAADRSSDAKGSAAGRLLGGNLSLVASMLGTPYQPDFRGAIVFLEEIGEDPYRVDRMLTQLIQGGVLTRAAGTAVGQFSGCVPRDTAAPTRSLEEIMAELARKTKKPLVTGFPVGHEKRMATVPIGIRGRLDTGAGTIELLEPAVA